MTGSAADDLPASTGGLARSVMLRLPEELYEWLRTQAFITHRSMNALGIEALLLLREQMQSAAQETPQSAGANAPPGPDR